jgi:hypothetical protein
MLFWAGSIAEDVEYVLNICETQGSILSTTKKRKFCCFKASIDKDVYEIVLSDMNTI